MGPIVAGIGGIWFSHLSIKEVKQELQGVKSELPAKNNEIRELNNFILSSITGGDSFCVARMGFTELMFRERLTPDDIGRLIITNRGEYPLYDLNVLISDEDKLDEVFKETKDFVKSLGASRKRVNIGTLLPNFSEEIGFFALSGKTGFRLDINVAGRNGGTFQKIRMKLIEGPWVGGKNGSRRVE